MIEYSFPNYKIIQFAKAPLLGHVKTRMQPALSLQGSVDLHRSLTQHTVNTIAQAHVCPHELWVDSNLDHIFFRDLVAQSACKLKKQEAGDLGVKMASAVQSSLSSCKGLVLVGSDCPFIDEGYLRKALLSLEAGNEAVIGPANDGGYVLLGLTRYHASMFACVDWGTEKVFQQTARQFEALGIELDVLSVLSDIDEPEDLRLLKNLPRTNALNLFLDTVT